jgi:hypothetical protein
MVVGWSISTGRENILSFSDNMVYYLPREWPEPAVLGWLVDGAFPHVG